MFLGGWRAPWPIIGGPDANTGWWPLLWFLGQGADPDVLLRLAARDAARIRYDQLMTFGWKVLIPVSLAWILMSRDRPGVRASTGDSTRVYIIAGAIVA